MKSTERELIARLGIVFCGVLALIVASCTSPPATQIGAEPRLETPGPRTLVRDGDDGLELHWWIVDNSDGAIGRTLGPYAIQPAGVDEQIRNRWEANGLRIIRAPIDRFSEIVSGMPPRRSLQRQWYSGATSWTECFRGRSIERSRSIEINGERVVLSSGTPRLLLRTWSAPGIDGPTLRFELLPQIFEKRTRLLTEIYDRPEQASALVEGRVFDDLTLRTSLDAEFIYLITAERPGVRWTEQRTSLPSAESEDEQSAGPEDDVEPPSFGPATPRLETLGELLFALPASETRANEMRAVIMLVPRVPDEFRLLP